MPTRTIYKKQSQQQKNLISPGHKACAGCGQMVAAKTVANTLGEDAIIANATGCLEVTTSPYPQSSWMVPWIHSLFENASAVASGIRASLDYKIKNSKTAKERDKYKNTKVVAQGGDGGTFDIGFGLISGMWERGEEIIYICYDNEAYSNTGIQASGATPWGANTTTSPAGSGSSIDAIGSHQRKKDMLAIALAHRLNYVAQTTAGYPQDIIAKIKKAKQTKGPSYIQILSPCIPGWKIEPGQSIEVAQKAVQTGLYPVVEYENGQLTNAMKVGKTPPKVEEYLKMQGRFKHLFQNKKGKEQIKYIQQIADENIETLKLNG
jgi:pyruvate ferredoxin oxidoreductase beta subunit